MTGLEQYVGEVIDDKYRLEQLLGSGGMGAVYLATHLGTERYVALKLIAPQFMRNDEFVERFKREARAAGRLRHPNVVDVTDFGFAGVNNGRVAYLIMEYLDGCTLGDILAEEKRLPLDWVVDILEQVCSAVHEAHQQGIIHRDLKPDNIWLEPNRLGGYRVKVLDFGIAKLGEATVPTINEDSASTIIDDLSVLKSATPTSIIDSFPGHGSVELETPTLMQPAEVSACIEEYGRSPVALLDTEGLLSKRFTAVHAIHVTPKAIASMARAGAIVCACPTTERNLGDGVVPVDSYFDAGVRVSLGSDSQIQIDLLEDARELEYHLRLQKTARNVLAPIDDESSSALARRLFECATINGAESIGFDGGKLEPGAPADFFTVDLDDLSIAGASPEDLLANIVFSLARTAIRDVVVAGRQIVDTD